MYERAATCPQNRVLEPREVAQVIAFLCSNAAGDVNSEAIIVALGGVWQALSASRIETLRYWLAPANRHVSQLALLNLASQPAQFKRRIFCRKTLQIARTGIAGAPR